MQKQRYLRQWRHACLLAVCLLLPAAIAQASSTQLCYSWRGNVGPLNPHLYSPNQMFAQAMVYEPLLRYLGKGQVAPWLAESWEISTDQCTYTFHLRKGVRFSDGKPFDSRAAKQNIDTILANARHHAWIELVSRVKSVRSLDTHTLAIDLKEPYYPLLQDLTLIRPFRFLSPAAFPESGSTVDGIRAPVGTGPWKLVSVRLGEFDIFDRNEDYWGPKPAIEKIKVNVIADPNTCALALETGQIDLIYGDDQISPDTFQRFRNDPRYTTEVFPPLYTRALVLNSKHGPTRELSVRKAIQHAVNKAAIVQGVFSGTETRADALLHSSHPYCDLSLPPYAYDPEKARRMLDAAGWQRSKGSRFRTRNGAPMVLNLLFIGKSAIEKTVAEVIQADLYKVGIQVKLNGLEDDIFAKEQKAGGFDMSFNNTWGPPYEPHGYCSSMRVPSHGDYQAQSGLPMKPDIDAAIGRVLTTTDEAQRREIYRYILTTLHEQAVYLPISYSGGFAVYGRNLSGVAHGATKYEIPFEGMSKQ